MSAADGCPSEAVLDRFELGELDDLDARAHVEACRSCQARLTERRSALSAMPGRAELLAAIHVGVAAAEPSRAARTRWRWPALGGLVALGALALAVGSRNDPAPSELRSKGAVGLSVYVDRGGRVRRAHSGERFSPGDRLRFEVDLSHGGEIMVVGLEASGELYAAFPVGRGEVRSRPLGQGADQVLPGAVELDDSIGREALVLVRCSQAFELRELEVADGRLVAPPGCATSPFLLEKVPR